MFTRPQTIRFQHCDPAGIVFYPRYFEMLNLTVEEFFETEIGASFHQLHIREKIGVPLVHVETDFRVMSELEDVINFNLHLIRLGRSSVGFLIEARCGDELRLSATMTLVAIDLVTQRACSWPEALRTKLKEHLEN